MKSQYKHYVKASFSFDPTEFDDSEISVLSAGKVQAINQLTVLLNPESKSTNVKTPIVY
jgi:hypothetical protein